MSDSQAEHVEGLLSLHEMPFSMIRYIMTMGLSTMSSPDYVRIYLKKYSYNMYMYFIPILSPLGRCQYDSINESASFLILFF